MTISFERESDPDGPADVPSNLSVLFSPDSHQTTLGLGGVLKAPSTPSTHCLNKDSDACKKLDDPETLSSGRLGGDSLVLILAFRRYSYPVFNETN